jgi:hypothetical protein
MSHHITLHVSIIVAIIKYLKLLFDGYCWLRFRISGLLYVVPSMHWCVP